MSIIENFAALSAQEQREFAEALLKTINSERIFSDQTNFELIDIEASDLTGGLYISVAQTNPIEVVRKATWQVSDEDEAENFARDYEYEVNYESDIDDDALKAFKTGSAVIDSYKVEIEIDDVDEEYDPVDVEVEHISHEDAGIGSYEFWGDRGYDSRPYVEVKGVIVKSCDCSLSFYVEPNEAFEDAPAEVSPEKPAEKSVEEI